MILEPSVHHEVHIWSADSAGFELDIAFIDMLELTFIQIGRLFWAISWTQAHKNTRTMEITSLSNYTIDVFPDRYTVLNSSTILNSLFLSTEENALRKRIQ